MSERIAFLDTTGDVETMSLLLAAAGDPVSISQAHRVLILAWDDLETRMTAAPEWTFQAWIDAVIDLAQAASPEAVVRAKEAVSQLEARRRGPR